MPSVTTLLLCAVALFSAGETLRCDAQPGEPSQAQAARRSSAGTRRVVASGGLGGVDEPEHRSKHGSARLAVELTAALKAHGRYPSIVKVGEVMSQLPLEVQERLNDCSAPSCLLELGALLSVSAVITPRLTLEAQGYRLEPRLHGRRGAGALATVSQRATEAELVTGLPELVRSLWKKATVPAGASVSKPEGQPMSEDGSMQVGLRARERWRSRRLREQLHGARRSARGVRARYGDGQHYDQLASAQTQARFMWGAGLALTGAGIAGFSLIGR